VTIGRDSEGIDYEALLFEQLLNDPKTGEREIHNFLEHHPDLLAEAMMGVPISHQSHFPSNKQIPDFVISHALPRDGGDWAKLLELKGPEAKILANKRHLHRNLSPAVMQALAQVNDYNESVRDPLNLKWLCAGVFGESCPHWPESISTGCRTLGEEKSGAALGQNSYIR
jgi:hypothetical protein